MNWSKKPINSMAIECKNLSTGKQYLTVKDQQHPGRKEDLCVKRRILVNKSLIQLNFATKIQNLHICDCIWNGKTDETLKKEYKNWTLNRYRH